MGVPTRHVWGAGLHGGVQRYFDDGSTAHAGPLLEAASETIPWSSVLFYGKMQKKRGHLVLGAI